MRLDELRDDAVLPHPVHLRDMILRTKLDPTTALDLNREFQDYLTRFGELQKVAREILERVAAGARKACRVIDCGLLQNWRFFDLAGVARMERMLTLAAGMPVLLKATT